VEYGRSHGSRWLFDIEAVRANARARAELETWPFTSATIDLLGMRRIYRVRGEAQWHRAHVGFVHPIRNTLVSAGLSGYDIAPAGTVESWRPVFLVFGGADRQHDTLDTNRLQLVALSLGFGWTAGGTRVDLAAQQFVFAKAFRTVTRSAPDVGTTPDPSSQPSSGDSNSGWSGVEVRASLSRSFGPSTKR
jgi:hypothetical protein